LCCNQVFLGAAGLTYGADNVMQFYIPSLFTQDGSGPAFAWDVDIHLPGSSQMQYIKKVILDRPFSPFNRIPDQNIVIGDSGTNGAHIAATRDKNGQWLVVYTPTGKPFVVDTGKLSVRGGQSVNASWYNPLDGSYQAFNWSGLGMTKVTPPSVTDHADWALVLDVHS
jgi:Putative collagen-binding domain of a collagenase/Protein of unknown function (DUF4038)